MNLDSTRSNAWRWSVCVLLLFATLLNYMDRQTLSQLAPRITKELSLSKTEYGGLELAFGLAFALGMIVFGVVADLINVRWLYPLVLLGWSLAGVATGYAPEIGDYVAPGMKALFPFLDKSPTYLGFAICRFMLGLFEAGQWPCALITTQRLLSERDRPFGNSILQSGASLGAILTPLVVKFMLTDDIGSWRGPFKVIGFVSMLWVIPWLAMTRNRDLAPPAKPKQFKEEVRLWELFHEPVFLRRFSALVVVVISINLTWQFFRAWLPLLLKESYNYSDNFIYGFTMAYYIATDIGCISVGVTVKFLAARGTNIHSARLLTFAICCGLTTLSLLVTVVSSQWLVIPLFLVVGFGALGLFPNYYALTQELTTRAQGKLTGMLGAITWLVTALMQLLIGKSIDQTGSYATGITVAGIVPLFGLLALVLLWKKAEGKQETEGIG